MELVLPNNYVTLEQDEMLYLEGEGILALLVGGIAGGIAAAAAALPMASIVGTIAIPVVGAVSKALILGAAAALPAFFGAFAAGHHFGRIIEDEGGLIIDRIRNRIDSWRSSRG